MQVAAYTDFKPSFLREMQKVSSLAAPGRSSSSGSAWKTGLPSVQELGLKLQALSASEPKKRGDSGSEAPQRAWIGSGSRWGSGRQRHLRSGGDGGMDRWARLGKQCLRGRCPSSRLLRRSWPLLVVVTPSHPPPTGSYDPDEDQSYSDDVAAVVNEALEVWTASHTPLQTDPKTPHNTGVDASLGHGLGPAVAQVQARKGSVRHRPA